MTVLMVLSLIVMATFEQAQWVKRGQYYAWLQVKMQDRLWQQLAVAEAQLPQRVATGKCFVPYSVGNDYFFMINNHWPMAACAYTVADEQIQLMYENMSTQPCAQIKGSRGTGVNFFRISVHSQLKASGQKMVLQAVAALPIVGNKNAINLGDEIKCREYTLYEAGRQSWLLQ